MKTIQLYRILNIKIDDSLVNHILTSITDQDWMNPQQVFKEVINHLKEHEVDDARFYLTSAYIMMVLSEVEALRDESLESYINQLSTIHGSYIH